GHWSIVTDESPARSCDSLPSFVFWRRRYKRENAYTKVSSTRPRITSATDANSDAHLDVRFGSKADICNAKRHVRFSDRESGLPQTVMSALPPKADMCSAVGHVRFGPTADSCGATKKAVIRSLRRRETVVIVALKGRAPWRS